MPGTSRAVNPKGIEIIFEEMSHKYSSVVDGKPISYISGTQFLHSYFPVFDPDGKIAERIAKKEGTTPEAIKAKWRKKGNDSCNFGTRVHETIEDTILGRQCRNTPENMKEEITFKNAVKIGNKLKNDTDVCGVEKIVFDHVLGIAGTIDLLTRSKKTGDYIIIDHKTNEKIETDNKYNEFCLDPISHIPGTNFHKYALQLNLYGYLLKYGKYIPKDANISFFINHVTDSGVKLMKLPDYQSEIKDLMIDYLLKRH